MRFLRSVKCALEGIWYCAVTQKNFRLHIYALVGVLAVAPYYRLSVGLFLILILLLALVPLCEMFNTAIELIVDKLSPEQSEFAKRAKDVSAGATLLAATAAVVYAIVVFYKPEVIAEILSSPFRAVAAAVYFVIGVVLAYV